MSRSRWALVAVVLVAAVVAAACLALAVGVAETSGDIVWNIRAPRVAMAIAIGAGLAVAGALMQGALANPLADPAIVGLSSGAALGAVIAVAIGASFSTALTALAACMGGAVSLAVAVAIALRDRRPEVVTLLLAGVAVTAFTTAALAMTTAMSDDAQVRSISFWTSGSLALSTWGGVLSVVPFVVVGLVIAAIVARSLDVLSLGDRAALSVGIDVARVRYLALGACVVLVAAGVACVGVIAFVGLLVPHAIRMVAGPRHGPLLVLSALGGALLILVADTLARTVANPLEIPIGAITAVIGAPVFFVLIARTRARQGGWA